MNSGGRTVLSSPLFASSSPAFLRSGSASSSCCCSSSSPSPSPSRATVIPMVHDNAGGRASTACHYSPSLVAAEEQLHGRSKDAVSPLMGEKALLELLLDMALEQQGTQGKKLSSTEEREESELDSYLRDDKSHIFYHPDFSEGDGSTSVSSSPLSANSGDSSDLGTASATLTKEVALLAEESRTSGTQLNASHIYRTSLDSSKSSEELQSKGQVFIRSTRSLERRSKRRIAPRAAITDVSCSVDNSKKKEKSKKYGRVLDPDEPFRLFLRDRETTEFLTAKEERHLFSKIQILMKLEEAHRKLEVQCGREPTLAEWAEAVGMSSKELQSSIRTGRRCREKMARSNFRLVIHVARKYEGYGLDIQDLVQDGCCGLMKTFEKFNPSKGCRFPTYAYWWIRQSIKKSIFKNSRLIRLPESVYALLRKVGKARMECIMEGEQPTNANVARRAGITIEKLAKLRAKTRKPRSMQDHVWSDEGVTFQEITEDPNVEPPDLSVDRMMMRQQVRDFLGILSPREKEIIEHRFGIHDGEPKTLHVIGDMFGLSKERIRQLQNRALQKLKTSASTQGFDVYFDLLT
ncbi:RNA polymerase sigma factor sigF, chloroplastic [Oryza brachyantha]|uniref:RNA polymerase sigma factor sigF, chloroplastic n=1 Tax=Oryza brachyantha TaxID=4533 RepID=UPI001ADCE230|nr:RNA polymerase sigma factor sigF, chloroplastic [Oryza brachyantha]